MRRSLLAKQPDDHGNDSDWNGDHRTDHQQFSWAGHPGERRVHAATIPAVASRRQFRDFVGDIWLPDVLAINLNDWGAEAESQI